MVFVWCRRTEKEVDDLKTFRSIVAPSAIVMVPVLLHLAAVSTAVDDQGLGSDDRHCDFLFFRVNPSWRLILRLATMVLF